MPGYFPKESKILVIGQNPGQLSKRASGWDDSSYSEQEQWSKFQRGYAKGLFEAPMGTWLVEGFSGTIPWSFTNIVKCRTPDNSPPTLSEIERCRPWLEGQISLIKPRAIITLGNPAFSWFDKWISGGISIDRVRNKILGIQNNKYTGLLMPMYHPAYQRYEHDSKTMEALQKLELTIKNRKVYENTFKLQRMS